MKTFVQLKDGIAFAIIQSKKPVPNSVELPADMSTSEVMNKKYNNGAWEIPKVIYYASEISNNNDLIQIKQTIFPSEAKGEILDSHVKIGFRKINGEWIDTKALKESTKPADNQNYVWNHRELSWVKIDQGTDEADQITDEPM